LGAITRRAGSVVSGFFGVGFIALAFITLLPAAASKANLLGYYGVCSWAPQSTAMLLVFAATSMLLAFRLWKR
jgi:hypothetical protein